MNHTVAQEDFDDFANPEDLYEALDLDNIPQLPTVTVPHAPGVVNAPRDKVRFFTLDDHPRVHG